MRVPVLVTLRAQEPLIESALAFREKRRPAIPITAAKVPQEFQLDESFPSVPIGTGRVTDTVASYDPRTSNQFAVRGLVEVPERDEIPEEIDGQRLFADPQIRPFPVTCGGSGPIGNAGTVHTKLKVAQLAARQLDGARVALAIMDTGINHKHVGKKLGKPILLDAANSWSPAGLTIPPGGHPVDHGSMCAYDALVVSPKATLLDFPILSSNVPGGSTMGGSLSVALLAYAQLIAGWAVAFAPGSVAKYNALVVSNSWGIFHPSWDFPAGHPGRYCDNPRHPFNLLVTTLAAGGADIVFAAGNCGTECPDGRCQARTSQAIMGANALQDVLTLGGCDTNDKRVGYSSQGPSITGLFQQKPDVTAYTHFLGSEAFGAGSPDTGTSAACPVAAGCVAALRSKLPPVSTPPSGLFAQLRATAHQVTSSAGWNTDYGFGIIDPDAAGASMGV